MSPTSKNFVITEDLVLAWANLSGDFNRIHVDEDFARGTVYGLRISHGPILASMVAEWVRELVPDNWVAEGEIEFRFLGAVVFPDTIVGTAARESEGALDVLSIECVSGDARRVLSAKAKWPSKS